jgi:hypothetical protein
LHQYGGSPAETWKFRSGIAHCSKNYPRPESVLPRLDGRKFPGAEGALSGRESSALMA